MWNNLEKKKAQAKRTELTGNNEVFPSWYPALLEWNVHQQQPSFLQVYVFPSPHHDQISHLLDAMVVNLAVEMGSFAG